VLKSLADFVSVLELRSRCGSQTRAPDRGFASRSAHPCSSRSPIS
jgi:hypothetical protein